jgi:hypothetical protein
VPYTDDLGRERWETVEVSASANDPEALARAAEDEWEKRHPNRVGLLPEDLEWEEAQEEQ